MTLDLASGDAPAMRPIPTTPADPAAALWGAWFSGRLAPCGHYALRRPASDYDARELRYVLLELALETVRREAFPSKPCRWQVFYAGESPALSLQKRAMDRSLGRSPGAVFEVEADRYSRHDLDWTQRFGDALLDHLANAHRYWRGEAASTSPRWEYLLVPPVRVVRRVEEA